MIIPYKIKQQIISYSFFIRFIFLFSILYFFFQFYWGITGLGGKIYSPFLAEHFNIIKGISSFLTRCARLLLNLFGYDTFQRQYNALRIANSRGVIVNPSCLGWAVLSFWTAFVYANKGKILHKLRWIIGGCAIITLINITRIALIALANHVNSSFISRIDHHQAFNIASYCCVFILMFWYLTVQKKYERTLSDTPAANNRLITVQ